MGLLDRMGFTKPPSIFDDARRTNARPKELVMLPTDWNEALMPQRALVDIKHDGIHNLIEPGGGALTREGVPFRAASHLFRELVAVESILTAMTNKRHYLMGEYVNPEGFEATLADQARGRGTGGMFLFDAVDADAYHGRANSRPLEYRRAALAEVVAKVSAERVRAVRFTLFTGPNRDRIEEAAGEVWRQGLEGIVVKDADSPYVRARTPLWMRIKRQHTIDAAIANVFVTNGRVGAFSVRVNGVESKVGSGIPNALRSRPGAFIPGRMVEIKSLGTTASGALRSASFVRFRDDKRGPHA